MRALDGLNEPHLVFGKILAQAYDTAAFKCAADAMLVDAGAELLFHAVAVGVVRSDSGRIDALLVETKSGRFAVRATNFIDCSGDGDLAHFAGVPDAGAAGSLLFPTLMFRVGHVDDARAGEAWKTIPALMDAAEAAGEFRFPRRGAIVRPQRHGGEWRVNVTQLKNADGSAVDGTDARSLSAGEVEGRRQAVDYLRFLRARVPGFESAYLLDIAPQVGIRETRRLLGEHVLSGDEVIACASFADSIGVNGWPLELHVAGDVEWRWPPIPESRGFNQLPLRMLLPRTRWRRRRDQPARRRALRVDDARRPVGGARHGRVPGDGPGRRHARRACRPVDGLARGARRSAPGCLARATAPGWATAQLPAP